MDRKTAIVTGAAKGIGKAIAKRLIIEGYFVVICDADLSAGKDCLSELQAEKAQFIHCDVSSEQAVKSLYSRLMTEHQRLDVLVNNAGIIRDNMVWKMSTEDFDSVVDVNLKGTWLMCREAAVIMKQQQFGRIVNISSRAWLGNRGQSNYSASKAGVIGLTRVLALELGKYNVLVNAIAPGLIDTPMTQHLDPAILQNLIEAQPTKTMGKPEDVANAVAFLVHENTRFITGQTLYVDGGKSIGAN